MGEVKHTPGPWRASRYQGRRPGEYNYLIDSGGVAVLAEVFARDAMNTALNSEANARLITAAPDLLAELKKAIGYDESNHSCIAAFGQSALDAIAKAEGCSKAESSHGA